MITTPLELDHGFLVVPNAPGIGIELAEDITEKFPPLSAASIVRSPFDGSVRDL